MWLIDHAEDVPCFSDDCFETSVISKTAPDGGKAFLEIAPKFRYHVRVTDCDRERFQLLAANLLLSHNLLVVPSSVEGPDVRSAVVTSLNYRITRIFDGEEGAHLSDARAEAVPFRRTAWGAPAASRQPPRAMPETRFTSWRFQKPRPQEDLLG